MKVLQLLVLMMSLTVFTGCVSTRGFPAHHGIANFDRVSDSKLYRGAQPNATDIEYLKSIGVVKVINFRQPGDSWPEEKDVVESAMGQGAYVNIPLNSLSAPIKAQMERILAEIQSAKGKVFIHCQWGCDRTGTATACYRIRFQKVPNTKALQEAVIYGMSPFEVGMKDFIRHFR